MTLASARRRYVTDAIQTVSPQQLVVMLYDRLLLDLTRAEEALELRDFEQVNNQLTHAQDIILELEDSLDVSIWAGGAALMQLYRFIHSELIAANVGKESARIATCRALLTPLADAWKVAAGELTDPPAGRAAVVAATQSASPQPVLGGTA